MMNSGVGLELVLRKREQKRLIAIEFCYCYPPKGFCKSPGILFLIASRKVEVVELLLFVFIKS